MVNATIRVRIAPHTILHSAKPLPRINCTYCVSHHTVPMALPLVEFSNVYIAIRISVFSMAMLEPIVPLTHVSRSIGPQALPITVSRASDEFTQVAISILRTFFSVALSLAHCPLAGVIDGVVHGCQGAVTMALILVELSFIRPGRVSQFAKSLPFAIYPLPLISHTIVA